MGNHTGFDKIISGVTSGLQFATKFQQLGLQRAQVEQQAERSRVLNQQVKLQTAQKGLAIIEKAAKLPPKTGRSFLKSSMPALQNAGINLDPVLLDSLWDPEMARTFSQGFVAAKAGFTAGDPELAAQFSDQFLEQLGPQRAIEMFVGLAEDQEKRVRAAVIGEGRVGLEKLRQQAISGRTEKGIESKEKIAGKRIGFEKFKERRSAIKNLRTDVAKITKDFDPQFQAMSKILKMSSEDLKNPQNRIALVRLAQQLSEARNSVVRGEEFKQVAQAAPALERARLFVERFATGQQVTEGVALDIKKMARTLRPIALKNLKDRLSPFAETVKSQGFTKEAKQIFGTSARLFRSQFGGPPSKKKGAVKTSPRIQSIVDRAQQSLGRKLTPVEIRKLQSRFGG